MRVARLARVWNLAVEVWGSADEARDFLDTLVEEAATRPVVVALRADRLADLTSHSAASRLVERGLYLVGGLDEPGLRRAVTGPAQQAGLILQPGLVDLLVTEVRDDPGALPLLSHALLETWKRREGNTLTVDGFDDAQLVGADFNQGNFAHDFLKRKLDEMQARLQYVSLNTDFTFGSDHSSRRHF